ncbi:MAG: hypothetical protein OIF47_03260 [Marinibacterium sp.]|nr:hypothetical protein [Marinibacterium sp.]
MKSRISDLDEFSDVLASMRALEFHLTEFDQNNAAWKWIVISAHSMLQGMCVCYLTHTDGSGALERRSEEELRKYHAHGSKAAIYEHKGIVLDEPDVPYPEKRIANFHELLRRLPKPYTVSLPKTLAHIRNDRQSRLFLLNDFRNEYIHFKPWNFQVDLSGAPPLIEEAVMLSKEIATAPGWRRVNHLGSIGFNEQLSKIFDALEHFQSSCS